MADPKNIINIDPWAGGSSFPARPTSVPIGRPTTIGSPIGDVQVFNPFSSIPEEDFEVDGIVEIVQSSKLDRPSIGEVEGEEGLIDALAKESAEEGDERPLASLEEPPKMEDRGIFSEMRDDIGVDEPLITPESPMAVLTTPVMSDSKQPGLELRRPITVVHQPEPPPAKPQLSNQNSENRFDLTNLDPSQLDKGVAEFACELMQLGLPMNSISAVINGAMADPDLKQALDILCGKAATGRDTAGAAMDNESLLQAVAVAREKDNVGWDLPTRSVYYERLKDLVRTRAFISRPVDLTLPEKRGASAGNPRIIGRLSAMDAWYYRSLPIDGRLSQKRNESSLADFLRTLIGKTENDTRRRPLASGDYMVVSYDAVASPRGENIYVITPITTDGDIRYPVSSKDTGGRMVIGVVDGFQIQDAERLERRTNIVHAAGPYILTCKMVVRGKQAKADKQSILLENGESARPTPTPMYLLEPAALVTETGIPLTPTIKLDDARKRVEKMLANRRSLESGTKLLEASTDPEKVLKQPAARRRFAWY